MSTFDIKKFLINEGMTRVSRDRKRLLKEAEENNETTWIEVRNFKIVNSSDLFDEPEDEEAYNQALRKEGVEDGRYIVIDADSDDVPGTEPDYIITTESGPWMSIEYLYRYRINEGMTIVSRDRKRLLKEETEYWTSDDYDDFVDSAVGTAAPGMESFGTAFAKNLVTSERIKVVNDGSTYVVYYAKAGEPFVEVTPDNIESLNLTVDFSSPKNWEIEDTSTDDEEDEDDIWIAFNEWWAAINERTPDLYQDDDDFGPRTETMKIGPYTIVSNLEAEDDQSDEENTTINGKPATTEQIHKIVRMIEKYYDDRRLSQIKVSREVQ